MRARSILVLAVLGSMLLAASAQARDVNRDRIPDRWEKRHGLSLKVKQTSRDQDRDGFKNRAEWRAKTDPRNADTDGDGIPDSEENAGTVSAYDPATGDLEITLFDGGKLSGKVTEETRLKCDDDAGTTMSHGDDDGDDDGDHRHGHEGWGDDDPGHGDWGDDGDRRHHHGGCDSGDCPPDALAVGANVKQAELKVTSTGREWEELELRITG